MTLFMATYNYFYVLYCQDQSFYGGYTTDLKRRLDEHNQGIGAKYTRPAKRRPIKCLYAEAYPTKSLAMKAEYAFKKHSRQDKELFLSQQGIHAPYQDLDQAIINYQHMGEEDQHAEPKEL